MSFISPSATANLVFDGAYVEQVTVPAALPAGTNSNVLAVVGAFTDGPVGIPKMLSTLGGYGPLLAAFGDGVVAGMSIPYNGIREITSASPETSSFAVVRATDGSETSATLALIDTAGTPGTLVTITWANPGTNGAKLTGITTLTSGSAGSGPIYSVSLAHPYLGQQTWRNIAGAATPTGAYAAAAFIANAVAAINGTAANQVAFPYGTASAGSSTAQPLLATVMSAAGGSNGTGTLTTSGLIGTDGISARKGIYALRGQKFGGLVVAGCTDPTLDATLQAFLDTTGGVGFTTFPSNTSTTTAQTAKAANSLSNRRIIRLIDWAYAPDAPSGQSSALVSPLGFSAGIVLALNPWEDPANKPEGKQKAGILGTEKTVNGPPVDPQGEGSVRKTNGFNFLTGGQPRSNGQIGLAFGKTSDGSNISDVRMYDYIAGRVLAILNRYVGKSQGPPPVGAIDTDPVRKNIRDDFARLKAEFLNPQRLQLGAFGFSFIGSANQVAAGYCPWSIQGTTLAGIEFAIAELAVGTTVQAAA